MQKNELWKNGEKLIRILAIKEESVLIIDCIKRSMPSWIPIEAISCYETCDQQTLLSSTDTVLQDVTALSVTDQKRIHERYTMIAGLIPFIGDVRQRNYIINQLSEAYAVSKQTIRKYLCLYLVYQDISVFAPKQKQCGKKLSDDEKNMRWALNKFYYSKNKNSLQTAYIMMLKEKYRDTFGQLQKEYPTINQFRYFYRKHKNIRKYYISRTGIKNYQRNHRPLLGDGMQAFASTIGTAMLDATICDIYLVNEAGQLVGRPILTACCFLSSTFP